jgi:hypothetical protein
VYFQGFQKCTIFAQQIGPLSPLGANFQPPFLLLWWVWFGPKPIWEQKNWWNSDHNPHFYTHATFLAGNWYKSSPPLTPLTSNSLIFMQKFYIYVIYVWKPLGDLRCEIQERALIPPFLGGTWLGWLIICSGEAVMLYSVPKSGFCILRSCRQTALLPYFGPSILNAPYIEMSQKSARITMYEAEFVAGNVPSTLLCNFASKAWHLHLCVCSTTVLSLPFCTKHCRCWGWGAKGSRRNWRKLDPLYLIRVQA